MVKITIETKNGVKTEAVGTALVLISEATLAIDQSIKLIANSLHCTYDQAIELAVRACKHEHMGEQK